VMTDDELRELPDVTPTCGERTVFTIDGRRAVVPVAGHGYDGPLFHPDNEPMYVTDSDGVYWEIGYMPHMARVRRRPP